MIVQHNLTAMNANRMLGLTTSAQAKSTEKLSSGFKINRAADAAGFSISEKMRTQIRGVTQASDNAQDGISCVQTAEGALTEVNSMLQRMNELTVKASNGTLTNKTDRKAIQTEVDALITEIDRVSETTKFNDMYLLKGKEGTTKTTPNFILSLTDASKAAGALFGVGTTNTGAATNQKTISDLEVANWLKGNAKTTAATSELDDYLEVKNGKIAYKEGKVLYKVDADKAKDFEDQLDAQKITADKLADYFELGGNPLTDKDGKKVTENKLGDYFKDGVYQGGLYKKQILRIRRQSRKSAQTASANL